MRVLALVGRTDHVCYRYRVAAFRPAIEQAGGELRVASMAGGFFARLAALRSAEQADVVIVQRRLLPWWQLRLLRRRARALVFDFDDAVFRRSSYSRRGSECPRRQRAFEATVRAADLTIAGNNFLRERALQAVDESRVCVVPTCVDVDRYHAAEHKRIGGEARAVWIGQRSTMPYLAHAREYLAAAAERVPGLSIKIISNEFDIDCGLPIIPRTWSAETEAAELADADIGISWLSADEWSLGKCGLKVLQYMAAGLPVVANPAGENSEMVVDGVTGFLVRTPAEWGAAIDRLARDPALRSRLGAAGRRMAAERYGVTQWAPKFVAMLERLSRYEVSLTKVRLSSVPLESRQSPADRIAEPSPTRAAE